MRHANRLLSNLLFVALAFAPSCGQMIWKSSGHSAVTPDHVQILTEKPAHYERLGTVTHLYVDGSAWQDGGDGAAILHDLLTEAGGMGANVLLLKDDTTMADSSITLTYQGKSYLLPVIAQSKTVVAQGIFVPQP